jgi:spermidine synthase
MDRKQNSVAVLDDSKIIPHSISRRWFFGFFFISGLCSILYEIVWLRLAMSQFGVTTAMVSIVLSMFMAGLGIGSWQGGKFIRRHGPGGMFSALRLYALAEILIGVSSIAVQSEFSWGRSLLHLALHPPYQLPVYYLLAGIWMLITLVPWCACMGATFPFAMSAVREQTSNDSSRSFSYLYLANVLGATVGTWAPLFLIELFGFRTTLHFAGLLNLALGVCALALSATKPASHAAPSPQASPEKRLRLAGNKQLFLLFGTGLTSMAMEVVWIRIYTPTSGTVVYTVAWILGYYLLATYLGSVVYRKWGSGILIRSGVLWAVLGLAGLAPMIAADPRLHLSAGLRILLGVIAFTGLLGFITPMLVDQASDGDPDRAGKAYAVNVLGCILGPLLSGFILLPTMNERIALLLLSSVWFVVGIFFYRVPEQLPARKLRLLAPYAMVVAALLVTYFTEGYAQKLPVQVVLRDSTATVMALGDTRQTKRLLVNGVGITQLDPITKIMAHFPLAYLGHPPVRALDICFGMGTTFRSLMSWGIHVDAVDLVPSVPQLFPYFHADAPEVRKLERGRVIIDDGRRYLEWTSEKYDLITIDPPPPVQAAGSSLLYSKEFYELAKRRLQPDGILAQWLPGGDAETQAAVTKSIKESFPYVKAFTSLHGWGVHYFASQVPLPNPTATELAARLPAPATTDLLEWGNYGSAEKELGTMLDQQVSLDDIIAKSPATPALTDDRPINEYYFLRHRRQRKAQSRADVIH